MLDLLVKGLGRLPALRTERRPNVAAFIGFFFGGLGLGLYFRSFVDFLLPIAVTVVLIVTSSSIGGGLASF
ncbi:MAG TPA: hypothetical protein VNZ01_04425, partial [Solirubrobacteraceae bacterium]|nr:hypothetical protein [Solirubrobacteraceae bacterium]